MARNKVLIAPDIIPGKTYMAKAPGGVWEPVLVETTDQPGYLRGHVFIENFSRHGMGYSANARVRFLESGKLAGISVRRRNIEDPWELADVQLWPTLADLPGTWIDEEIAKTKHSIAVHENRLKILNVIKARIT